MRGTRRRWSTLLVALGLGSSALSGCDMRPESAGPAEAMSDPAGALGQSEADLYVASSTLWRPARIPVCWENPSSSFPNLLNRLRVQTAVARTWESRSGVRFTGWGTCAPSGPGIRIQINDEGPHVKALGNRLNGMAAGMVLNFTFNNWSPSCRDSVSYCVDAIAVHEFGHALGYAHEQNRSDRPSSCTEPAQGSSGDLFIGPWDLSSVMNYCNPHWNGDGNLSAIDMQGARATYGVPWVTLGGVITSAPAVSSWSAGRLDVFARGTDNALYHKWFDGSWQEWESLGGSLTSDPAAVSWGPGRIDVFARGTDNSLIHTWFDGSWHAWESLGGVLSSGPTVSSRGAGRLDVFVRGVDNALYHREFNGAWQDWTSLGGSITSDPASVSWNSGRIDVFARGTDNALHHKWFDGGWSSWGSLGGYLTASPTVSSWAPGRLDVFVRGSDSGMHHLFFDGGWSAWEWLGGELSSAPEAVSWGPGRLDIFYAGPDGALRQSFYDNGW